MKKVVFLLIIISTILSAENSKDSSKVINNWHTKMLLGLNMSQIAFSNWSKGGENSITWTLLGDFELKYIADNWSLKNDFKFAYGRTKLGDADFRTNNNEINLETVLTYKARWVVDPFFSNGLRTQVTTGYDYEKDPT